VNDWGTTAREEAEGEGLDRRLARELPESWAAEDEDDDGLGDKSDTDGELRDDEVGDVRSGGCSTTATALVTPSCTRGTSASTAPGRPPRRPPYTWSPPRTSSASRRARVCRD